MSDPLRYPTGFEGDRVTLFDSSGNALAGIGGGAAQLQTRNAGDTAWQNVIAGSATNAVPVNVVAGGAGGGTAQLAIRNAGDAAWINVIAESATNRVPVSITGPLAGGKVDINIGSASTAVAVTDNSGSLTVDAPVGTPVFVRLSDGANPLGTLPVSGTFWQATQPVSGTFWQATQPVSGTFWQATQPVSGTVTANQGGAPWSENITQLGGTSISTGVGATGAGVQRVILADPSSTQTGYDSVQNLDVDETEDAVKASAGQLYGFYFSNTHASAWRWLKFYNDTVANVIVGTTTPKETFGLPPSSSGFVPIPAGIPFSAAITIACTTGVAVADTGAPGTNEVVATSYYK